MDAYQQAIREWVARHQIDVDEQGLSSLCSSHFYNMGYDLFFLLRHLGVEQYAEMGTSPDDYLPGLICE